MRAGCALAMLASLAWGQASPDGSEIGRVRENIRAYLDELPLITCTEDTKQTVATHWVKWTETREDGCDTRHYKLFATQAMAIAGGPAYEPSEQRRASGWREQLTDASLVAATGFLAAIADTQTDVGLRWVRMGRVNGRAVSVFSFYVAMPDGYVLAGASGMARVPFKGLLYADTMTGALVRVEIECVDIPRGFEYTGAAVAVEFGWFDVAGRRMALPSHSVVRFRMTTGEAVNEAEYSAYRMATFGTDTEIRFGDEAADEKRSP